MCDWLLIEQNQSFLWGNTSSKTKTSRFVNVTRHVEYSKVASGSSLQGEGSPSLLHVMPQRIRYPSFYTDAYMSNTVQSHTTFDISLHVFQILLV